MIYSELKNSFIVLNSSSSSEMLTAHIIFTEGSFTQKYPLLSRTYRITSDAKAFQPNLAGYSIFGDCLDGSDQGIRLDYCMKEERANVDGWKVQECYILEQMPDVAAIPSARKVMRNDGTSNYCFGDTIIHADEIPNDSKLCLQPIAGIQNTCGKWVNLSIDRLYGYCELLERHINKEGIE